MITYNVADPHNSTEKTTRSKLITCENDIDKLRKFLNVPDLHISVKQKYGRDYWNTKRNLKRTRETDEHESVYNPKRLSTTMMPKITRSAS
jgi:hypothetical protein